MGSGQSKKGGCCTGGGKAGPNEKAGSGGSGSSGVQRKASTLSAKGKAASAGVKPSPATVNEPFLPSINQRKSSGGSTPAAAPPPQPEESTTPVTSGDRKPGRSFDSSVTGESYHGLKRGSQVSAGIQGSLVSTSIDNTTSSATNGVQSVKSSIETAPQKKTRPIPAPLSHPHEPVGSPQEHSPTQPQAPTPTGAGNSTSTPIKPPKLNWKKGEIIGRGTFGVVWLGLDLDTGRQIAIKEIDFPPDLQTDENAMKRLRSVQRELNFLKSITHVNIVQYLGMERRDLTVCILMEYVPGGSLLTLLKKFGKIPETVAQKYTRQILSGLELLHSKGVVHRDIKAANVLVGIDGTVKLADFGNARQLTEDGEAQSLGGSPYWMAPEVIQMTGHSTPADVWSVGATVVEMVTGKPPWSEYPPVPALYQIGHTNNKAPRPGPGEGFTSELLDFLDRCFHRTPMMRWKVPQLLAHPWMLSAGPPTPSLAMGGSVSGRQAGAVPVQSTPLGPRSHTAPADYMTDSDSENELTSGIREPHTPQPCTSPSHFSRGTRAERNAARASRDTATTLSLDTLNGHKDSLGCLTMLGKRNSSNPGASVTMSNSARNNRYGTIGSDHGLDSD
eukprot:TRINITY_DN1285_c4_g1_i1.p1 TRINITY_DN1285_c4_g1~~TRINITY_DN1285_c4_g1_i1.p1  ORF type:complete len:616 (+),score=79.50 TRINITY_DN1285_c4_g1_i1:212-2059(+)